MMSFQYIRTTNYNFVSLRNFLGGKWLFSRWHGERKVVQDEGERRMSYYRDRGEWLLFLGQPAAPTIHPYASEIMLSACPYQRNTLPKKFNFYRFFPQIFFFWKRSEVAYVAWSFIFTFIYSIATSNMPKSHIRWRGEQIQFIETSYCSDNFHKISNFCRLLGETFMKEILVVFQTYSCLL